jgi:hypothetical protein
VRDVAIDGGEADSRDAILDCDQKSEGPVMKRQGLW